MLEQHTIESQAQVGGAEPSRKKQLEKPPQRQQNEKMCVHKIGKFMISQRGRSGWGGEESYDNFLKRVQHFSALLVGCFDSVHTVSSI